MNTTVAAHLGAVTLLLGAGLLHANLDKAGDPAVHDRIAVMERAITASSVTELYSEAQRRQHLALTQGARNHLAAGNTKTALAQLEQAGRELYAMEGRSDMPLSGDRQRQWLEQMARVYTAMIPVAREIAADKGAALSKLQASQNDFDAGVAALQGADVDRAEALMTHAYHALQAEVVALRSGDLLTVEPPPAGTEQGWQDAQRRYQDWRFFADWMEQTAASLGIDPDPVAAGSQAADRIYEQARQQAEQSQWLEASNRIDRAYRVMESHWREAGLDI